ncbi:MAG: 4-hydroxybutyrate CoA-transferase [Anaerolineae bacterium]|nr:4-hydroxybutyrate CoA-transferase [Anaerolineae bacterium]
MTTWRKRILTADEAAGLVQNGQRVFLTGNCSTPQEFLKALVRRYETLENVEVVQLLGMGTGDYITPDMAKHIRLNSLFLAPNVRVAVGQGLADFTPCHLSQIPLLFRAGRLPIDVAVIQVSVPDEHGFCSYGVEVGVTKSAAESAKMVIAEVNPNMPRILGDSFIHVNHIHHFVEVSYNLPELHPTMADEVQTQIAQHIAQQIPDGATLQMGIGGIPDAVLRQLTNHRDLGIHTELFSDGVMEMIERGVITNRQKTFHPGKVVAGFVLGTRKLYDFAHDNPIFELHPTEYVNDPFNIARNDKMMSINSAIEVDITGQVCSDSIGPKFYSGAGGQLDFVRGATRSKGGKSFIALPSTTKNDTVSRIVPQLKAGAGVVTTRYDVRFVATEYGTADLWGMTLEQRAVAIANLAHPNFRDELLRYARDQKYLNKLVF